MPTVMVGDRTFQILAIERQGSWLAQASSGERGDRFGGEFAGSSRDEAIARAHRWLEWQHRHAVALAELQDAERAYHRAIAEHAFASPDGSVASLQARQAALNLVEAARVKLDEVRARQPAEHTVK